MAKMIILLIASLMFTASKAGYADPPSPMTPEVPPTNANAYGYAFSGGWPDVFPDNSFLGGGAMPIGEFLSNLRKQQENFESNILNWASDAMARGGPFPPEIPKNLQRDAEGVYAGGIIGPSGVYQTAKLFPENPNIPNIETRFASSNPSPDGNNFVAVASSSQSGSRTVDGKTTGFRKATTTVNDNGKVTTYTVQDP